MDINLSVVQGDITQEESDAIVCPANNFLQFNGGVAE
jgi:O-acetyl-ADP-ribose deacetylase (regulator of RNase III)